MIWRMSVEKVRRGKQALVNPLESPDQITGPQLCSGEDMSDIYKSGIYKHNNPTWHVEDSPWKAAHIERMLRRNEISPSTICEIGCGAGEILVCLASAFPQTQFHGYEVSPQAFALCNEMATDQLTFHLRDLSLEDGAFFDVLLVIDVFEHVDDYLGFLRRIKQRAQAKIFHIPLDLSLLSILRVKPILAVRQSIGHLHYFFKDTAIATLTDCGYHIIDYTYT